MLLLSRTQAMSYLSKIIVAEVTTTIRGIPQEVTLGRRERLFHAKECVPLGLFWVVGRDEAGESLLRLARDGAGQDLLMTPLEAALEKVRALEAELAKRATHGVSSPRP